MAPAVVVLIVDVARVEVVGADDDSLAAVYAVARIALRSAVRVHRTAQRTLRLGGTVNGFQAEQAWQPDAMPGDADPHRTGWIGTDRTIPPMGAVTP